MTTTLGWRSSFPETATLDWILGQQYQLWGIFCCHVESLIVKIDVFLFSL